MRLPLAVAVLTASVSIAEACVSASFAHFDFAAPTGLRYTGKERVKYFIGRVLTFYWKADPPRALIAVLREYPDSQGSKKLLKLPDVADLKMAPFSICTNPMLRDEAVGVFAYYEKDGELWLAWEKGNLY